MPGASCRFERMDGAVAVDTTLREHHQRDRVAPQVESAAAARDPTQALGPGCNAAGVTGIAFEQDQIKLAALKIAAQLDAELATYVEPQPWPRACELRQHRGQAVGSEILR